MDLFHLIVLLNIKGKLAIDYMQILYLHNIKIGLSIKIVRVIGDIVADIGKRQHVP